LYQSKQTPGCPGLHIYRSRAIPAAPLEPREQRESLARQWDTVEGFYSAWEKDAGAGFREYCHDFHDLEDFESLFRKHFREFLSRRLDATIASVKKSRKTPHKGSNPFRSLDFFDFEHSAVYQGRTRAVGEVFDVLKTQAAAKKSFLLVLGPSGSGKSSFVRAGVLPLITRGATPAGAGPWRRALTRPGATGDPFDAIADALLAKSALPELRSATSPEESRDLASQLRKDPDETAARIRRVMDQLAEEESDHLLANRKAEELRARENGNGQIATPTSLAQAKPMARLVLVVDQLEELFTRFSSVIQQKYIAALCALANCQDVLIIATLRSDLYSHYQQYSGLTALGGRYELQPPTPHGIANIIRFQTEAAGLTFERDPKTNRSLEETIVQAAVAHPEPLPLLEHLLSRLYERQLARKDGLLLFADYRAAGGFHHALEQHAEFVLLSLKSDEQEALPFVFRDLLVPSRGEETFLNRRSVPYRHLVLYPQLSQRQQAGAKGLVDRLIKEGLLSAKTDPQQELFVSIPQEALLWRWPRLRELLSEDRHFLRMRERLDASMNPWITNGRQREDLLDRGIALAEGQTLLTGFGSHLSETEIEYIEKSLARHKPRRKVPQKIGAAAIAGLAVFGAFVGGERFNAESQRANKQQDIRLRQQDTDLETRRRSELEAERGALELRLKESEQKLQLAQQNADLALGLGTQLEQTQKEKAQLEQQNADLNNDRRAQLQTQRSLETQLKDTQDKLQIAQKNTSLANTQLAALAAELKKALEEKAQRDNDLASGQNSEQQSRLNLETQLKDTQDKLQLAQKNADLADTQRAALEADLKKTQEEKAQLTLQNINLANGQNSEQETRRNLEAQLKDTQDKLQLAQKNVDLADTQRSALDNQLKNEQVKFEQAQAEADRANTQLIELEAQLKQERETTVEKVKATSDFDARLNQHPEASPTPSPPAADDSGASNPQEAQSGGDAKPLDETESLRQFVLAYIGTAASNNTSIQRGYFADRVNFYGKGILDSSDIEASTKRYDDRWPIRKWEPRGEAKVVRLRTPNLFAVAQPFTWTAADGSRHHAHGNATLYLRVRKNSQGDFQIIYIRQFQH